MIRLAAAAFLVVHGVAHLVGFLTAWRLGEFPDAPYGTVVLDGNVEIGEVGIRLVGLFWLLGALAFAGAAAAVLVRLPHRARTVALVATASLVLCVVGLPAAQVGVLVNLAILMAVAAITLQRRTTSDPEARPLTPRAPRRPSPSQ